MKYSVYINDGSTYGNSASYAGGAALHFAVLEDARNFCRRITTWYSIPTPQGSIRLEYFASLIMPDGAEYYYNGAVL